MASLGRRLARVLAGTTLAASVLSAQAPLGKLLYSNSVGRGVILTVQDGAEPAYIRLKPESGDAERMRRFILQRSGLELQMATGAIPLAERVPAGLKAGLNGPGLLLKAGDLTWWRYAPGLVVPARFTFDRQGWTLISAELPPRILTER
jgi:hypothetical protein